MMPPPDALRVERGSRATLIALILLVSVPVGAISALAYRIVRDEQRAARMRFTDFLETRLMDVRLGLGQRVQELGQELARRIASSERTTEGLRKLRRELPLAHELFVLNARGDLIFPPYQGASPEEQAFIQRTAAIWANAATLYEPAADEGGQAEEDLFGPSSLGLRKRPEQSQPDFHQTRSALDALDRNPRPKGDSLLALAARRTEGWLSWYWQDGLHLLFWRRTADGSVIGAEVDRVVLLSRLLASLPERAPLPGRTVLLDAKGDILHGWGPYRPPRGAKPDSTQHLAYPLDAWRVRYFSDPAATRDLFGRSLGLAAGLGVLAVSLALSLLAAWLWRASTRAMREARQRVSFVTQVSHELKTPLANIRLYAELLEDDLEDRIDDDGPSHRLSVIISESERLSRLIGNILTFTRQQRGESSRPKEPVGVDEVVCRTVERFRPALEGKHIEVHLDLEAPRPAFSERDGLEQVLGNLLGNVEKYAASGRWLRVRSDQDESWTRIRVEDRGPGVPRRLAERIFEPFQRLSDRLDEGVTGTGIGLTIARTLVEAWGGRLAHAAPEDGQGAVFVIELRTAGKDLNL